MKVWLFILASCLLTINCEQSDEEILKEVGMVTFNGIKGALGAIPVVGSIVGAFTPFVDFLIGKAMPTKKSAELKAIQELQKGNQNIQEEIQKGNQKTQEEIQKGNQQTLEEIQKVQDEIQKVQKQVEKVQGAVQKGFEEFSKKLDENIGKVQLAVELDKVRDADNKASILIQYIGDIVYANSTFSKNFTIHQFLEGCKKNDPYETILQMTRQVSHALRSTYKHDSHHAKTPLMSMKNKLYGILHELSIAVVLQELLLNRTEEVRNEKLAILDRKMQEINKNTDKVLDELANKDLWPEMQHLYESSLNGVPFNNMLNKTHSLMKFLKEIHTNDLFCVYAFHKLPDNFAYRMTEAGSHHITLPKDTFIGDQSNQNSGDLWIVRSRSAFNMTYDQSSVIWRPIMPFIPIEKHCSSFDQLMDKAAQYGQAMLFPVKSQYHDGYDGFFECDRSAALFPFVFTCYGPKQQVEEYYLFVLPH